MTRSRILIAALAVSVVVVAGSIHFWRGGSNDSARSLVNQYCGDCHNGIDFAGSMRLDDKDLTDIGHDAAVWERVVRKLKTGMMPPAGEPRPARERLDALTAELEEKLDQAHAANPVTGPSALRRLNRTEYANAIRDLFDLNVDASTLLPLDDSSEGFDNMASALGVSPSLVESYVSAAMKISRWALGDITAPRSQAAYAAPQDLDQGGHLEGMPIGTRGGMALEHLFPVDADYEIRVRRGFGRGGGRIDLTIDGEPIPVEGLGSTRIPVSAGPHTVTVAMVDTRRSAGVDDVYSAPPPTGGIQSVEIDGPLNPTGISQTPSREKILVCVPESAEDENECAREIISTLATRAFRRPLATDDLPALFTFYQAGRSGGDFEAGIQQAVARILVDPRFIYRIERDRPDSSLPGPRRVDDYEFATRLSFFIWSSIPDEQLLTLAATGRLQEPATLEAEVTRMLADPKSNALIDSFAEQWLFLRELESVTPDSEAFNENLRRAMAHETKQLFATIMRDEMSILRLLDASFTFVDEKLAEHYGLAGIHGSHFRRIELPNDSPRRGLLGHASILTVTSVTNRTSPVLRGSWILETLLGSPAPVPPPGVETTLEGDDGADIALTVRERLEAHRENPVCASCHAIMDPLGFSLENFDLIGGWRDTDAGLPIDTQAVLTDGTVVDGPATLRESLLSRPEVFVTTATEKLMTYALGRGIEHYDMPSIRAIVRQAADEDYRFSALVLGIVESEAFGTRTTGAVE
jgi:hypothetical protein